MFIYISLSPILFIAVSSTGSVENTIQPVLFSIVSIYCFCFYILIGSDMVLKKSLGYGLAVLPLVLLSSEVDP